MPIKIALLGVIRELVDHPDAVSVNVSGGDQLIVFEIDVHKADLGKIIGKNGSMASSLSHILMSISARKRLRTIMEIIRK